jgi:hypothetical protein
VTGRPDLDPGHLPPKIGRVLRNDCAAVVPPTSPTFPTLFRKIRSEEFSRGSGPVPPSFASLLLTSLKGRGGRGGREKAYKRRVSWPPTSAPTSAERREIGGGLPGHRPEPTGTFAGAVSLFPSRRSGPCPRPSLSDRRSLPMTDQRDLDQLRSVAGLSAASAWKLTCRKPPTPLPPPSSVPIRRHIKFEDRHRPEPSKDQLYLQLKEAVLNTR